MCCINVNMWQLFSRGCLLNVSLNELFILSVLHLITEDTYEEVYCTLYTKVPL